MFRADNHVHSPGTPGWMPRWRTPAAAPSRSACPPSHSSSTSTSTEWGALSASQNDAAAGLALHLDPTAATDDDFSPESSRVSRDDHRYPRRLSHRRTDGTHKHPGESTTAMAADHNELGTVRFFDQPAGGLVAEQPTLHPDVGVLLQPSGHAFGQGFLALLPAHRAVHTEDGKAPTSLHACSATSPTPWREASSNASEVADSDAGEPSMPSRAGAASLPVGCALCASWMTATGQCA